MGFLNKSKLFCTDFQMGLSNLWKSWNLQRFFAWIFSSKDQLVPDFWVDFWADCVILLSKNCIFRECFIFHCFQMICLRNIFNVLAYQKRFRMLHWVHMNFAYLWMLKSFECFGTNFWNGFEQFVRKLRAFEMFSLTFSALASSFFPYVLLY